MKSRLSAMKEWRPPAQWKRITTLDAHTGGEPLRIILEGFPDLPGTTMLEKRKAAKDHYDDLRKALMWEPRGHREMYGCILTPPVTTDGHFGVLFTHNEGFSTMCGHGIIALAMAAVKTGFVAQTGERTEVRIDSPAGRVTAFVEAEGDQIGTISFENVPSFVVSLDNTLDLKDLGTIHYDLAFGGAYYVFVDAAQFGLTLSGNEISRMIDLGMEVKRAVAAKERLRHPSDPDLGFLYGTIFIGPSRQEGIHSRNVCVFAEGEVDRSPTGTGVSGRLAIHHARGEITKDQTIAIESIAGSIFRGRVIRETSLGDMKAIVPLVEGSAWLTGRHEFLIDPNDPLKDGFLLT